MTTKICVHDGDSEHPFGRVGTIPLKRPPLKLGRNGLISSLCAGGLQVGKKDQVTELFAKGTNKAEIARRLKTSGTSVRRILSNIKA